MEPNKTEFPLWLKIAYSQLGEKEKARGDNGAVQLMFGLVGSSERRDEVPWCSAFVGAAFERCKIKGTSSLMARSWLAWGEACEIRVGAIVVFPRGNSPEFGHVGFVYRWTDKSVWVLGGNQSNKVSIQRFDRSRALGYRWPTEQAQIGVNFDRALSFVLRQDVEGKFTDHPRDPGGATMRGVTLARYRQFLGNDKATKDDLRAITDAEVRAIYQIYYWFESFADLIPAPLCLVHFDCAVNQGPGDAARFLQQSVGATVDGDIGPQTLNRVNASFRSALPKYFDIREADYRQLDDFDVFGRGWLNRLSKLRQYCSRFDWPNGAVHIEENSTVSKPEYSSMPEAPKWWLNSKTVWGNIIVLLSYAVPILSAVMGWPITSDDITLINNVGISLIETIGTALGVLISIYGRFKADRPVERKPFTIAF